MSDEPINFDGKRILVVEDDFMLASDICRELRNFGATVLGPAPTPFYAMQLINRKAIDAAVLDVRLHGTTIFEVADTLRESGVPIIFATAYGRAAIPGRFKDARLLDKPLDRAQLIAEIRTMIQRPRGAAGLPPVAASLRGGQPHQIFARALAGALRKA